MGLGRAHKEIQRESYHLLSDVQKKEIQEKRNLELEQKKKKENKIIEIKNSELGKELSNFLDEYCDIMSKFISDTGYGDPVWKNSKKLDIKYEEFYKKFNSQFDKYNKNIFEKLTGNIPFGGDCVKFGSVESAIGAILHDNLAQT